ncbi:YceH family protein [Planctomycetota bacterium]
MDVQLTAVDARVLGSLIEKESTTPDYYPLSLNAITNACNQKSNRNPVMQVDEKTVLRRLDSLLRKQLIWHKKSSESRVLKYAHRIETIAEFSPKERATICVLLLRGPQTVGEIRGRTRRMCSFDSLADTEQTLEGLASHDSGAFVVKLPREAGRRERRYAHLLCGPVEVDEESGESSTEPARVEIQAENERIAKLEEEVARLREQLRELQRLFDEWK